MARQPLRRRLENQLREIVECLLPVLKVVRVFIDVPDVWHALLLQVSIARPVRSASRQVYPWAHGEVSPSLIELSVDATAGGSCPITRGPRPIGTVQRRNQQGDSSTMTYIAITRTHVDKHPRQKGFLKIEAGLTWTQ